MLATHDYLHATLIAFVVSVALIDWRTHRIPNLLCAIAAMVGLALQIGMHGEAGLLAALAGATVGFAMFLPFYVVRAFGAGDVKAMATVGIFLGVPGTMLAVGMTLIAGALLGAAVLCVKREHANATMHRTIGLLLTPIASMRGPKGNRSSDSSLRFPYGVAIACGVAVALIIRTH